MTEQELNKACDILWDIIEPYVNTSEDCEAIQNAFRKAMTEKTNPLFEQCLANVNPETRVEVRKNMEFLDKACDAYCQVCGHYPHKVPTHICRQDCDYYMKFRKVVSVVIKDSLNPVQNAPEAVIKESLTTELAWQDMAKIADIIGHTSRLTRNGMTRSPEDFYSETLKRFKEIKEDCKDS